MNQNMVIFDENSFRQGIEKIKENKKNIITLFNEENLDMEKINNVDVWYSETSQNVLSKYQELQQNYESIEDSLNNVITFLESTLESHKELEESTKNNITEQANNLNVNS